jgi:hypothetical protein
MDVTRNNLSFEEHSIGQLLNGQRQKWLVGWSQIKVSETIILNLILTFG